ncbi:unnamed protein product [Caenorhabditis brenneri]
MLTDVTLVVEGIEFYVSKTFLANQSSYFKSLFFGDFKEAKRDRITLNEVGSNDFSKFLEVLYGKTNVNDSNIDIVLHLSDMLGVLKIIEKCELFLLNSHNWEMEEKLELAERYHLSALKEKCLTRRAVKRKLADRR